MWSLTGSVDTDMESGPGAGKIGLPETKLGIIPGAGGTQRATRLIGLSKAKELMYTGRMIGPEEALQLGRFTWRVIRDTVDENGRTGQLCRWSRTERLGQGVGRVSDGS
jgi:1,4-dihydroxy-2-naphthoyl-CoA synthase